MNKDSRHIFLVIALDLKIAKIGIKQPNNVKIKDNLIKLLLSNFFNLIKIFNIHQKVATLSSKIPRLTGKILLNTSPNLLFLIHGQ